MGIFKTDFKQDDSILLVDVSYIVHALISRSLKIYSRHFDIPEDKEELYEIDFSEDEDYMRIFKEQFINTINRTAKKYHVPNHDIIFAIDCSKKDIWRRSIFPEYKLHRMVKKRKGVRGGPIFNEAIQNIIPALEARGFGKKFYHPLAEADDVIAVTTKLVRANDPDKQIIIFANDSDLMQLIDDNLIIITTRYEVINEKTIGTPQQDLLLKIVGGDGSDGISSIFEKVKGDPVFCMGCGKKTALKLVRDPDLLKQKLKEFPDAIEKLNFNQTLINFKNIPESIQTTIFEEVNQYLYN